MKQLISQISWTCRTCQSCAHHQTPQRNCTAFYMQVWHADTVIDCSTPKCRLTSDIESCCRWGATPLQDAYLSGDKVMCALLERAGGKKSDDPAIREKLPALLVSSF